MAFQLDLNELPISSPREATNDAVSGGVSVCAICRKEVSGRRTGTRTAEQGQEFKCFTCLLKNGGGKARDFDINALPDTVAEENVDFRIPASSFSFGCDTTARQPSPMREDDNLPCTSAAATGSGHFGFPRRRSMYSGVNFGRVGVESTSLDSPNNIYLQALREYVAERSGFLGEGWSVEFEFCNKTQKTSPVYIAPSGARMRSKETVVDYLGLPNDSQALTRAQPSKQRQSSLGGAHIMKGPVFPDKDAFPYQFQDFYLVSAGTVDQRSTYHNNDQIWPVGYRSAWHDRVTGSLFVCDVADGGDSGPVFRVHRYSCSTQSLPVGSTILSRKRTVSFDGVDQARKDDSTKFQVFDDESLSTITLLNVDSPPSLDSFLPARKVDEEIQTPQVYISSTSELEAQCQREGNEKDGPARLSDMIGDFQVEARSTIAAWGMVSQAILLAFHQSYKQKGAIKLFCGHDAYDVTSSDVSESLSRFCHFGCIGIIPPFVQNESECSRTCDMLSTWLNRDRFGMDSDFVQEIIEQLPGVEVCSLYSNLTERKDSSELQTVGSGFLEAERIMGRSLRISKRGEVEDILRREPCPPGKQLSLRLPSYLIGDSLQIWEHASRLSEVLGLGRALSFQELESELLGPWFDGSSLGIGCGTFKVGDADLGSYHGHLLTKICGSLLQLLVRELLSKASAYVCPDVGEIKSRRGRKKDLIFLAALKKTKLDVLPVNGLTWQEIARRYILAVLCLEGLLDSGDIVSRESGKVFHCLRGDGGILCGSLTGVAALEGDGVILADAMKDIFGSLKNNNEIITLSEREVGVGGSSVQGNDNGIPEWVQVLEPVRKLPTNVGARIRKRVNESLEKNPPEWAKIILQHSISKEVYKGNASGPTKRAVISVLDKVSRENPGANTEKKEKLKITTNLADLITKQCRVVLRSAAAADDDRVFCNLLGRISLNPKANYDEGLLGYPAMVSRPLDFRTIDLKLAAGAYCGSHKAFVDDVREVWRNIRTAYGDRADLVDLAENLSQKFEDLYEKEVLSLVHKFSEMKKIDDSSPDAGKERDDLLASISKSLLPRAPWEEGLCKVCGMDKDDDNVLLCDKCDSEYHKYCLNPPLVKIPEGNWYCPSCIVGGSTSCSWPYGSVANQIKTKGDQGQFMRTFLEQLARLANLLEIKEYWEFSLEERVFFLKFLFDEAVTTATVHKHMEDSLSRVAELQQKLRVLANELKLLKSQEDFMQLSLEKANSGVHNECGDLRSDTSSSLHITENSSRDPGRGASTFTAAHASGNEFAIASQQQAIDEGKKSEQRDIQVSPVSASQLLTRYNQATDLASSAPASLTNEPNGQNFPDQSDVLSSQELRLKVRNDISNLQSSIASTESELHRISVRKELLGQDSNGRAYWIFCNPAARPWVVANGTLSPKQRRPEEFATIPGSDQWMLYQSVSEIQKLVGWLNENNLKEKELRDCIVQLQSKSKNSECNDCHILSKDRSDHSSLSHEKAVSAGLLVTKAITALEAKLGPGKMRRCECLELLLPSKEHCLICHNSFPTKEELIQHSRDNCKVTVPVSCRSQTTESISKATEDTSKRKRLKIIAPQEKPSGSGTLRISSSERQNAGSSAGESSREPECPFKFEEIMTRFFVSNSVQDAVNEVGFIGQYGLTREGRNVDRVKSSSSTKDKSSLIGLSKSSIVRELSLRPLVDRACDVMRLLKINLLDIDSGLPQDALRTSRMNEERRRAWRAFVKSAKSIYEMVQAAIVLEDVIKSEYLKTDWWYWSSPGTAAKITTLSALALRIYALDSAISYDQPFAATTLEPNSMLDEEEPASQKMAEPDPVENPRTRTRASKRRRE